MVASLILWIFFRSSTKRSGNYKFFYETEVSKAQLAEYAGYEDMQKEKKELKKKIAEAKHSGESFAELEKEYEEKFGKEAMKARKQALKDAAGKDKENTENPDDGYKSILDDEETDENKSEDK